MWNVKVKDEIGVPDILVNNAGSYYLQVGKKQFWWLLIICFQNFEGNMIDLFRIFAIATTPVGKEWWIIRFSKTPKNVFHSLNPVSSSKSCAKVQKYKSTKCQKFKSKIVCQVNMNILGYLFTIGEFLPAMKVGYFFFSPHHFPQDRGSGHIVNISSDSERVAFPGLQFWYSSLSKFVGKYIQNTHKIFRQMYTNTERFKTKGFKMSRQKG